MKSDLSALFNNAKKVTLVSVPEKAEPENETIDEEIIEEPKTKKIKLEREYKDPSIDNAQTVFVGNVPSGCTQKELKKLFSEFGTIETIRLRNLIPLNPKQGKRLAFIKKEFHPLQKTITAFVRFTNQTEAENATRLNGFLYKEHHLRVDMAHEQHEQLKHDNKRSIFIGNLPFDVNDEDVWKAFEECGEIENVRLVRDRATSVGKGFGYVLFQDEASVALALSINGNCKIGNREIRIKTSVKKPKPVASNVYQKNSRRPNGKFKSKKSFRSNDNDGVQQGRVEKRPAVKLRKEKQKKKKKNLSIKTNNSRKDVIQLKKKS
jgi:nucleolar protein 12